jgi:hypothetical protein
MDGSGNVAWSGLSGQDQCQSAAGIRDSVKFREGCFEEVPARFDFFVDQVVGGRSE